MMRSGKTILLSIFYVVTNILISCALLTGAEHSCGFDYGLCYGWADDHYQDVFDWTNQYGSTPSYDTGPSSSHGGFGKYMYIETSSPRRLGDNAILEYSVPSDDKGKSSCLSFYYHMYGDTVHTLNVFNGGTKVFTKSGNQGNLWLKGKISITTLQNKIKFEGVRGTSYTGDIAIDDVSIVPGICKGCDFDNGLCYGWADDHYQDVFDWTNLHGPTPSYNTGPSSGHGGFGKYMYIETSSPRRLWDNAILEYSVPSNDVGNSSCLSFYYHMYGDTVHTFNVFNGGTKVFTKSGNQGNLWLSEKINIATLQNKIKFEGIRGTSYTGDIAIDDVSIVPGICKECKEALNQSFGRLDIRYTSKFDPYCNWLIGNGGISKKFAVVSIHQLYFGHTSEYVKVFDGNGTEVVSIDRRNLSLTHFQEISFGSSENVTIQASLIYSLSYINIDYGIMNQAFDSARPLANWNLNVANKTTTSIRIYWNNPANELSFGISFYVAIAERMMNVSSVSNGKLLPGNTTSSEITNLEIYTEYNIYVIIVDSKGTPFKSAVFVTMTDEGIPSRAPSGIRVTSVEYTTDLLVEWNPLSQIYANGKILGYIIYYREDDNWWSPYKTINTSGIYPTQFVLKGLKPAERYRVAVAAFTSKGRGPVSYDYYGTTGEIIHFSYKEAQYIFFGIFLMKVLVLLKSRSKRTSALKFTLLSKMWTNLLLRVKPCLIGIIHFMLNELLRFRNNGLNHLCIKKKNKKELFMDNRGYYLQCAEQKKIRKGYLIYDN